MKTERNCEETPETLREVKDLTPKSKHGEDESKYVDLGLMDSKTDRTEPEKRCRAVCKNGTNSGDARETEPNRKTPTKTDAKLNQDVVDEGLSGPTPSSDSHGPAKSEERFGAGDKSARVMTQPEVPRKQDNEKSTETDDESHYITTHEIQLSELSDHETDYGPGVGSSASWDGEDNSQVCSFVDYASSDGGDALKPRVGGAPAAEVGTLRESDPSRFTSSDESASKPQQGSGNSRGQIHLSIRTTSRAINDPGNLRERGNILYHARRSGDMSRYVLRGVDGKTEALRVKAKGSGRLQLPGSSSGASSAVSELDDADQEVRNLTARAFKSLAYPYFDAINFSTSSDSSASEHGRGMSRWSSFVDLKYGNVNVSRGRGRDQSVASHPNKAQSIDNRGHGGAALTSIKPPASKMLVGEFSQGHGGVIRLTETLNFRCNVKKGMSGAERRAGLAQNAAASRSTDEVTGEQSRGGGSQARAKTMEGAHTKAMFASSVIKNVLSKKMQFEQERKMERGEISEHRGGNDARGKGCRKPDVAVTRVDEPGDAADSPQTDLEPRSKAGAAAKKGAREGAPFRSQNSAFRCWKDEELGFQTDPKSAAAPEERGAGHGEDRVAKLTKMSHLFVPSIHVCAGDAHAGAQPKGADYSEERGVIVQSDVASDSTSESPEVKTNPRTTGDDKTEPFGVSKLRAPALAAALKCEPSEKVPHFLVRDIRDNKGKLQTPIHQVRDVRKLVKSSYHFVSLDNNGSKCNVASAESNSEQRRQTPRNPTSVSPIVIKCQSVNTNNGKRCGNVDFSKQEVLVADRSSPEGARNARLRRASSEGDSGPRAESQVASRKHESNVQNQAALEKLQAAVKTMEQLYVFEKNEWKRKSEPRPPTGCHEDGGEKTSRRDFDPHVDGTIPQTSGVCGDRPVARSLQSMSGGTNVFGSKTPKPLKMSRTRPSGDDGEADGETYLSIPATSRRPSSPLGAGSSARGREDFSQTPKTCSPEIPSAAIYHSLPLGVSPSQPHVYCFSPAITPIPTLDSFQATQRKMLLDPNTGNYYLVDTPVQPTTKRLFDPETGQYVDVPMPQPPVTPVPVPISPLALSPGAYGQTYMIYPGFMSAPQVIPARTLVQSQMSVESGEKVSAPPTDGVFMESPFYMATGKCPQAATSRPPPSAFSGVRQPVISITSQQGPRIIAPPSFDGTTMSFVVEHR